MFSPICRTGPSFSPAVLSVRVAAEAVRPPVIVTPAAPVPTAWKKRRRFHFMVITPDRAVGVVYPGWKAWETFGRSEPGSGLGRADCVPGRVGVVARDLLDSGGRLLPEVLLVRHAGLVDDERHHPRRAVVHRPGHEREPARHLAVHHVFGRAA